MPGGKKWEMEGDAEQAGMELPLRTEASWALGAFTVHHR